MSISMSDFDEGLAKYEAMLEVAKKMLAKDKPIEEIIEFTELSEAEILSIKASLT